MLACSLKYSKVFKITEYDTYCNYPFSIHTLLSRHNGRIITVGNYVKVGPKFKLEAYLYQKQRPDKLLIGFRSELTTAN